MLLPLKSYLWVDDISQLTKAQFLFRVTFCPCLSNCSALDLIPVSTKYPCRCSASGWDPGRFCIQLYVGHPALRTGFQGVLAEWGAAAERAGAETSQYRTSSPCLHPLIPPTFPPPTPLFLSKARLAQCLEMCTHSYVLTIHTGVQLACCHGFRQTFCKPNKYF